jgi:anti-sigma regulatory factor (Ser/Thr protein kinase)
MKKYAKKEIQLSPPPPCSEGSEKSLQIDAKTSNLASVDVFIYEQALSAGFKDNEAKTLELAIDEMVSNAIIHGYDGNPEGQIKICFIKYREGIRIVVEDRGKMFDPSKAHEPDLEAPLQERSIGGLGLFIAKQIMDEIYFEVVGKQLKRFTLVKRFE